MKRVAIVTGAAGGIGRATAETFHAAGYEAIGIDRKEVKDFPAEITLHKVDSSLEDSVVAFAAGMREQYEKIDVLVNNAAIQICKPLVEMTVEEWDATMASNIRSIFLLSRELYPLIKAAKGAIVNVSSVHAMATSNDIAAYAASKGGILALTRAMALEFGVDDVRVNTILPGAVDTPMLRDGMSRGHVSGTLDERMQALASKTVLGRIGKPEEIAKVILFLSESEQSGFMTGQSLIVDGGASARLSTE
jgi:NAD(P)-dependent dehydrogenase (short-subunit alcohol dehydrogenase family)